MDALSILDSILDHGGTVTMVNGKVRVTAAASVVGPDLQAALAQHRDLLAAHLLGRHTGHVLAPCSSCSALAVVHVERRPPTCRITPGCIGRHTARERDLALVGKYPARPKQAQPAKRPPKSRLLGPVPPFPVDKLYEKAK